MKKFNILIFAILLFMLGALFGIHAFQKILERKLEFTCDSISYNDAIYSAANYAQLLLDAREGSATSIVQRLECLADSSLLLALTHTNASFCVRHKFQWTKLKADREVYPRQTKENCEARINDFLNELIKDQSQLKHAHF